MPILYCLSPFYVNKAKGFVEQEMSGIFWRLQIPLLIMHVVHVIFYSLHVNIFELKRKFAIFLHFCE